MPDPILWQQGEWRWAGEAVLWPRLAASLARLTRELHRRDRGEARTTKQVREALAAFSRQVMWYASRERMPRPEAMHSLNHSGCWIASVAMMLRHFAVRIEGDEPTPLRVLRAFQDKLWMTLSGYCRTPGFDLISLLTRGAVTLAAYEDHKRGGIRPDKSRLLRSELKPGRAAIVNVWTHEFETTADGTHYAAVLPAPGGMVTVLDPAEAEPQTNSLLDVYDKVFQVFLYSRNPRR